MIGPHPIQRNTGIEHTSNPWRLTISIRFNMLRTEKVTKQPIPWLTVPQIFQLIGMSLHLLCFISNAVPERPVDKSQNFDGVAYIA